MNKRAAGSRGRVAAANKRATPKLSAKAKSTVSVPLPTSLAALGRAVEQRLHDRSLEFDRAKGHYEGLARAIRGALESSKPAAHLPRVLRPAPTKIREFQREMQEVALQMRLETARRSELLWVQKLLQSDPSAS